MTDDFDMSELNENQKKLARLILKIATKHKGDALAPANRKIFFSPDEWDGPLVVDAVLFIVHREGDMRLFFDPKQADGMDELAIELENRGFILETVDDGISCVSKAEEFLQLNSIGDTPELIFKELIQMAKAQGAEHPVFADSAAGGIAVMDVSTGRLWHVELVEDVQEGE